MQFNNLDNLGEIVQYLDSFCRELNSIIFVKDTHYKYRYVNNAFLKHNKLTIDEVIGNLDSEVFNLMGESFVEIDERVMQTGVSYSNIESITRSKKYFYVQKVPIKNKNNEIIGIFGLTDDISEPTNRLNKLNADFHLLEVILQNAPLAIFLKDLKGNYLLVNEYYSKYHNMKPEQIAGLTDHDLFSPQVAKQYIARDQKMLRENINKTVEITSAEINGRTVQSVSTKFIARDKSENPIGVVGISQDISDLWALENKILNLEKMESIQTLSAGIAHDLNNYLASIMGHASLLQAKVEDASVQKSLQTILVASQQSKNLIEDLLSFTKEKHVEPICFDSLKELTKIISLIHPTLSKKVKLTYNLAPVILYADKVMFHQAILNLVINANEAIPDIGKIQIKTSKVNVDNPIMIRDSLVSSPQCVPGDFIKIEISDTGKGISEKYFRKIFEPFFTTKAPVSGSGLGLSIVFNLIVSHRGFLELETTKDVGTTFSLFFPSVPCSPMASRSVVPFHHAKSAHILLIEDDQVIRETVSVILSTLNYTCATAINGSNGIDLFSSQKFDLIILDLMLPDMNGPEVYEKLVAINSTIPVIISSGYGKHKWHEKIQQIRSTYLKYLNKPFTLDELAATLDELLP